jgi:hypothetical protein
MSKKPKGPRKYIPVEEAVARWRKDPAYALEEELALVNATIEGRSAAGLNRTRSPPRGTQAD